MLLITIYQLFVVQSQPDITHPPMPTTHHASLGTQQDSPPPGHLSLTTNVARPSPPPSLPFYSIFPTRLPSSIPLHMSLLSFPPMRCPFIPYMCAPSIYFPLPSYIPRPTQWKNNHTVPATTCYPMLESTLVPRPHTHTPTHRLAPCSRAATTTSCSSSTMRRPYT